MANRTTLVKAVVVQEIQIKIQKRQYMRFN